MLDWLEKLLGQTSSVPEEFQTQEVPSEFVAGLKGYTRLEELGMISNATRALLSLYLWLRHQARQCAEEHFHAHSARCEDECGPKVDRWLSESNAIRVLFLHSARNDVNCFRDRFQIRGDGMCLTWEIPEVLPEAALHQVISPSATLLARTLGEERSVA